MNLIDTNSSVITFYKKFHEVFSQVDSDFNKLDELGGSDFDTAKKILEQLQKYHSTIYHGLQLSNEDLDCFTGINLRLRTASCFADYSSIIKDLQQIVHDFLAYETRWPGQTACQEIIAKILEIFTNSLAVQVSDHINFYSSIRILRELVADCSISIIGLLPLSKWSYGTSQYSKLTPTEQLVILLNQSILTDRMYYCLHSLEITLNHLNNVVDEFAELDWNVYYTVGFLNFKTHQYSKAVRYFERVLKNRGLKDSHSQIARERYFHANLLLAYCYEYDHDFSQAIRILAVDPEKIASLLDQQEVVSLCTDFVSIMDQICNLAATESNSLIAQYLHSYSEFEQAAQATPFDNTLVLDMQFEILHAFAHCLNEYSIKNHANTPTGSFHNYGKCIRFARLIMKQIASIRPEYWTCYATIHGECKDYHIALVELDNAQNKLSKNRQVIAKESLVAEISFFRYYFNMLCNQASLTDKLTFEEYSEKYDDDDAKCHLKIFEFRDELRRFLSAFYECVHELVGDIPFTENSILPIPKELKEKYTELCSLEPTLYMNASVRSELRLMQCAYNCIDYLRTYFINPTPKNLLVLQNACYRFGTVKQEFHQVSSTPPPQVSTMSDPFPPFLPTIVKDVFSTGMSSILSSLYSTDSIFILAPISGVVVFQYQTGTIQDLFSLTSILPSASETQVTRDDIDAIASSVVTVYNKMSETIGPREMTGIDWETLSRYTNIIYHWSSKVASQVVVCEKGKPSYVRQLVDEVAFFTVISRIKKKYDSDRSRKFCKNAKIKKKNLTLKCTLQETILPWLEIVNEGAPRKFYIAWDDDIEGLQDRDSLICFLIPLTAAAEKHNLHTYIRNIDVIYQQTTVSISDATSQTSSQDTSECTEDRAKLISIAEQLYKNASNRIPTIEFQLTDLQTQLNVYKANPDNENALPIKTAISTCTTLLTELKSIIAYTKKDPDKLTLSILKQYEAFLSSLD